MAEVGVPVSEVELLVKCDDGLVAAVGVVVLQVGLAMPSCRFLCGLKVQGNND